MKAMWKILGLLLICGQAAAVDIASLTTGEMAGGLKETLTKSAVAAVGKQADELVVAMNRAAEMAVPELIGKIFGFGR